MFLINRAIYIPLLSLLLVFSVNVNAQQKLALVIGNSDYQQRPFTNPKHDAKGVAQALRSIGFEVVSRWHGASV